MSWKLFWTRISSNRLFIHIGHQWQANRHCRPEMLQFAVVAFYHVLILKPHTNCLFKTNQGFPYQNKVQLLFSQYLLHHIRKQFIIIGNLVTQIVFQSFKRNKASNSIFRISVQIGILYFHGNVFDRYIFIHNSPRLLQVRPNCLIQKLGQLLFWNHFSFDACFYNP